MYVCVNQKKVKSPVLLLVAAIASIIKFYVSFYYIEPKRSSCLKTFYAGFLFLFLFNILSEIITLMCWIKVLLFLQSKIYFFYLEEKSIILSLFLFVIFKLYILFSIFSFFMYNVKNP